MIFLYACNGFGGKAGVMSDGLVGLLIPFGFGRNTVASEFRDRLGILFMHGL